MGLIKIGDQRFDTEKLSAEAKSNLEMVVATEQRIRELQREAAMLQTARTAYMAALKDRLLTSEQALPASPGDAGEAIKLG